MKKTEIKFDDGGRAIVNAERGSLAVMEADTEERGGDIVAIALDDAAAPKLADALTEWANLQRHNRRLGISHTLTDLAKCEPGPKR